MKFPINRIIFFRFSVVRESDPKFEFYIDDIVDPQTDLVYAGKVYTRKPLDRDCEGCDKREILIKCEDKGKRFKNLSLSLNYL